MRQEAIGTKRVLCAASDMGHMNVEEANEMLSADDWVYIDCRTAEEFNAGHVKDSVNIPIVFFSPEGMSANTKFLEELKSAVPDFDTKIIMGCKSGQRSIMASNIALQNQYDEVYNLTGGFEAWKAAGLPWDK